jgi:3-oxoacyl-[acyl-carrier-protein] synthase I
MTPLFVDAVGAVTPVGLTGPETCASIRAAISRIADAIPVPPPGEPIKAARVKAGRSLRPNDGEWLLNMASKALLECAAGARPSPVALMLCLPDANRQHPSELHGAGALAALQARCKLHLDKSSRVFDEGAGGLAHALEAARNLLTRRVVDRCIVGGVDSLVNANDLERLRRMNRLHGPGNPQGVIVGEGAVFLSLSASGRDSDFLPLAAIAGFSAAAEPNPVDGPKFSLGEGLTRTVNGALADGRTAEAEIAFVVSDHTGERYAAWETTISHARSYKTLRPQLPVVYPAMAVGHLGAAASALTVMVAAMAVARGYAPGPKAMCEFRSEGELRGACVVAATTGPAFVSPSRRRRREHH